MLTFDAILNPSYLKNLYKTIFLAATVLLSFKGFASGGPDAYGYTWITSADPGGPTYNWVDITSRPGVQTVTGLADDNSAASMVNLGFSFHYYWSDYSSLKVGSNGWVSFNNVSNIASCFPTIPTTGGPGDNLLAPLMSDLNFTGAGNPGQVKYWTNSVDSFIISYINVPYWSVNSPGWTGSNSFQIILSKSDSSITFQYGSLSAPQLNAACTDITVGIENSTGAIGLQPHSDVAPPSNSVIRFEYPNVVLLSIQDPLPLWNSNTDNKAEFIPLNAPYTLSANYKNLGNTAVTTSISTTATVLTQGGGTVHLTSGSIPSLAAGADSTINYSSVWTPFTPGQYSFVSSLTNSQDINTANNTNKTELEVVDVCASTMQLSYVTGGASTGSLNWNGGANDDGAAVYFKPPVYPYTVSQLQYYIASNVSDGYIAQIYADNGLNGAPGTLLYTETVPSSSVISAAWNTLTPSSTVTVTSGGIYVVWLQGGTTIFLGTETNEPRSNQNYEILDNAWAVYREGSTKDILIRATINNFSGSPVAGFESSSTLLNVAFTDTSYGPGNSYLWNFGDGSTSITKNPTHTYAAAGTYTVCLTATNPCDTSTFCKAVTVCDAPVAAYTSSDNNLNVSFTDASTGTVNSWLWNFGDGNSSTIQSPAHTYTSGGTYNVCLITTNSCGMRDTICNAVTVCNALVAGFSFSTNESTVTVIDTTLSPATSWAWNFGDGSSGTTQNDSHSYSTGGSYTVCLTVTDACGAIDSTCQTVNIFITSLEENSSLALNCYPNPSKDAMIISLNKNILNASIEISDLAGRIVWRTDGISGNTIPVNVESFENGLYLIRLISAEGNSSMHFIKN